VNAEALIAALTRRDILTAAERDLLRALPARERVIDADADIVSEGDRPSVCCLLLDGLAARYIITPQGSRQITSINVPGDFVDLHSFPLKTMDHGVVALSECRVAEVPHSTIKDISETQPHLTRLFWTTTLIDASTHRRWLAMMGRSDALTQLAHLLCELYCRFEIVGAVEDFSFDLPITQEELGDALGISTVHVNRMVRELRDRGLIEWRGSLVRITDWTGLAASGAFDPFYLYLQQEPR
jgi:CRP-like cAMP-binding protein